MWFYIRLIMSLSIFLFFIAIRRYIHKFIVKLFKKTPHKLAHFLDDATLAINKPLMYLWVGTGTYIALLVSPFIHFSELTQPSLVVGSLSLSLDFISIHFLGRLYASLFIITLTWGIYKLVTVYENYLIHKGSKFTLLDNALIIRFSARMLKFAILIVGTALVISQYTNLGTLLTSLGILGAAFTFIAKDTLTNIMSGIVLMIDTPFTIGDWIVVDEIEGIIEDVSFRTTRIRTFDQALVVVQNATLVNNHITNWTSTSKRRYRFQFGINYNTSKEELETFMEAIKTSLAELPTLESDSLLVYFDHFGDYSLHIIIHCFTNQTTLQGFSTFKEEVNLTLMSLAKNHSIDIAFPTQTLYVHSQSTS